MNNENTFELIIIGGGPAGVSAGVYAARKKLRTLFITKDFGGQSVVSETIENWTGEISIAGPELAKRFKEQIEHYKGDDFIVEKYQTITKASKIEDEMIKLETESGKTFYTKALLITTGAKRRQLTVEGADKFEHKGLTYCASCDGPLFTGKDVVVIGGGNSGFEAASQLLAYTNSVTLLHRSPKFNAEETMVENVLANEKMAALTNADISEVYGDIMVEGIKYLDKNSGEEKDLKVSGVFVEIGSIPATGFLEEGLVEKDGFGQIKINHQNARTSQAGIWAAGDCSDSLFKQNMIAAGDAVKAIEDIYTYLRT